MDLAATAVVVGSAYALLGAAVAVTSVTTRTLHLAIGPILVAGVVTHLLLRAIGVPGPIAAGLAVLAGAALSTALEPLLLRPLARGGIETEVRWLVGLAVAAALIEVGTAQWLVTRPLRPRPLLGTDPLALAVAGGLVGAVALALLLARTRLGRRLRVLGGSPAAAELSGVSPTRGRAVALALSGASATIAGMLLAPVVAVSAGQGPGLTLRGVAAAVVLGIGGPLRAVAAGIALGAVEVAGQWALPGLRPDVVIGAAVVAVLALRGGELRRAWGRAW